MNGGRDAAVPHTNPAAATADRSAGRLARKNRPACVTRSRPRVVTRTGPSCTAPRARGRSSGKPGQVPKARSGRSTARKPVVGVALSDGVVLGEGGGGLFVVPEREHHGAPNPRGAFAGERDGDRRIEPSQPWDLRGAGRFHRERSVPRAPRSAMLTVAIIEQVPPRRLTDTKIARSGVSVSRTSRT